MCFTTRMIIIPASIQIHSRDGCNITVFIFHGILLSLFPSSTLKVINYTTVTAGSHILIGLKLLNTNNRKLPSLFHFHRHLYGKNCSFLAFYGTGPCSLYNMYYNGSYPKIQLISTKRHYKKSFSCKREIQSKRRKALFHSSGSSIR